LSDISGQDIASHGGNAERAIHEVRDWLDTCRGGTTSLPGGKHVVKQYRRFCQKLPSASKKLKLDANKLTYPDICRSMESWLKDND
jgi:hypothetical protein